MRQYPDILLVNALKSGTVSILVKAYEKQQFEFFFCARRKDLEDSISSSITKFETDPKSKHLLTSRVALAPKREQLNH
ncbi:hypothetical protein Krac_7472 [Ktedonobacter racemifer DSM 44963]|uniref:Uncharacterized protein n=1 Tax=Ktedonobacter racemifer DSM 44963 TaxID=485913 RepID=D6TK85_KTERA|nr:hypothetical protein Krac_7472 [Ktedonobacter racemifer DSM 44963]